MKFDRILMTALACSLSAMGQGTIRFENYNVEILPIVSGHPGSKYVVSLYLNGNMTPLATTGFIEGTGLISPPAEPVVVPGHQAGSTDALFLVMAYEAGKTFETSLFRGSSTPFTSGPLGGVTENGEILAPPDIANLNQFLIGPEPSTIALAAVGVGVLALSRRKQGIANLQIRK